MNVDTAFDQKEFRVDNEYDVIVLRQALRTLGRIHGLGLVQQARITSAISDIARNILRYHWSIAVAIYVNISADQRSLDVVCHPVSDHLHPSYAEFDRLIGMDAVQKLVDETSLTNSDGRFLLLMRVWMESEQKHG